VITVVEAPVMAVPVVMPEGSSTVTSPEPDPGDVSVGTARLACGALSRAGVLGTLTPTWRR
jgi:hypothetical protein